MEKTHAVVSVFFSKYCPKRNATAAHEKEKRNENKYLKTRFAKNKKGNKNRAVIPISVPMAK